MAEITKRKLAGYLSLLAGFFLSLFSGTAAAKPLLLNKNVRSSPNAAQNFSPATNQVQSSPEAGQNFAPAALKLAPAAEATLDATAVEAIFPDTANRARFYQWTQENNVPVTKDAANTFTIQTLIERIEALEKKIAE